MASLHVLALTSPHMAAGGARIMAAAGPMNLNAILKQFRALYPEKNFRDDFEGPGAMQDLTRIDNNRGTKLLGGWRSFREAIEGNTEQL